MVQLVGSYQSHRNLSIREVLQKWLQDSR
jgi:hypothetical protein